MQLFFNGQNRPRNFQFWRKICTKIGSETSKKKLSKLKYINFRDLFRLL